MNEFISTNEILMSEPINAKPENKKKQSGFPNCIFGIYQALQGCQCRGSSFSFLVQQEKCVTSVGRTHFRNNWDGHFSCLHLAGTSTCLKAIDKEAFSGVFIPFDFNLFHVLQSLEVCNAHCF